MICTSIQNKTLSEITSVLSNPDVEMAEIRLDLCPALSIHDIETLFSTARVPLLATCRISPDMPAEEAERKLTYAAQHAHFIDIEIEAPSDMVSRIAKTCNTFGCHLIRSVHFFDGTPSLEALQECVSKCSDGFAEIIKIVTYATDADDVKTVQKLYTPSLAGKLIAFCMGEAGKQSRMDALKFAAPFTYAALSKAEATAPGQWVASDMVKALYGTSGNERFSSIGFDYSDIKIPTSKSIAQRAIIAAMMASGESTLKNYHPCEDSESAIALIRSLGTKVTKDGTTLKITGSGLNNTTDTVFVGESGFLTRFITPILALSGRTIKITGEKTLVGRPLKGMAETLKCFGVDIDCNSVPFTIKGRLTAGKASISGKDGSQIISGLMAALPLLPSDSEIIVKQPKSVPYIFMTQQVLQKFNIDVKCERLNDELKISIKGNQTYKPTDFVPEPDWSGAAPMLVAGAIFTGITLKGFNNTSLQADCKIDEILRIAGARTRYSGTETSVAKSPLHSFTTDLNDAPDLFPVVSVLAAFCEGTSLISGLGRLSGKESDRAKAITETLAKLGVKCSQNGDTLTVQGHSLSYRYANNKPLKGGKYTSYKDHRMVMALRIAELGASGRIEIDNTECVAKSYPNFNAYFSRQFS
ncbi:MAG: 3-phosphoshikimate 1-carboxyvinyltransferase [Paludibacteraceae bacterium]|nr:3-phosphoshikimate 1-carboxyvinyltransferase [Paludibacteraceae bacterium]